MRRLVIIPLLLLTGCSPGSPGSGVPRIDASSDEALESSLSRISKTLTEESRKEFEADCAKITAPERMKVVYRTGFEGPRDKTASKSMPYRVIDGMTATEVHVKALEYRANDDRLVAEAKAAQDKADAARKQPGDRERLVSKAIETMKTAAAARFGTAEAKKAVITAEPSGVKEFGEKAWEVTGLYDGPDRDGVRFKAPWTVRIEFALGELQCTSANLGERVWSEPGPATPPSLASLATASPPPPASQGVPGQGGSGQATEPAVKATSKAPAKGKGRPKAKISDPATRAAGDLERAKVLEDAGRADEALKLYQYIAREYAETPSGGQAKYRVETLMGKPRAKKK
jgi:hypothetical protein